jgi:RNA polymerase sigma factor (sigma-70 family)
MNEAQLKQVIKLCRRHDAAAQKALYKSFYGYIHVLTSRYASSKEECEEIVQDVFMKVFTKIDKYNDQLSFQAWIKKIAINTCIDRFRSKVNEMATFEISIAEQSGELAESIVNADAEYLLHLVQQLPVSYRTTFNMYAIDGYAYHEIAEMLQVSIGSVKSNLAKARKQLKEKILQAEEKASIQNKIN